MKAARHENKAIILGILENVVTRGTHLSFIQVLSLVYSKHKNENVKKARILVSLPGSLFSYGTRS